jgi:hypothetical protein
MLQVLAEVVRAEELFRRVAFPEFVHILKMADSLVPIVIIGRQSNCS